MNKIAKELVPYLLILVTVIVIRTYIFTPVRVNGNSMFDTLKEGNILILNKLDTDYERFDIVVINDSVMGETVVKRIIGMPGDTVELKSGNVYINNEKLYDPYNNYILASTEPIILGPFEYYVLGDNRAVSLDSREFGAITIDDIEGTVTQSIIPFEKLK